MKRTVLLLEFLFYFIVVAFAQGKKRVEPFVISGQFTNCPEHTLFISFEDTNHLLLTDTLLLDKAGSFYVKTYKVTYPQRARIYSNNIQINNLFAAPGYQLTLTADGTDFMSLLNTKKITGVGSESNRYFFLLDSILIARMDKTRWYELKQNELLAYIKKDRQLRDSVAHQVFSQAAVRDKYFHYFEKTVQLDNMFNELTLLLTHVNMNRYKYDDAVAIVRNNSDEGMWDNLYKEEFFQSEMYKDWIVSNEYLQYLVKLDCLKDSTLCNRKIYALEVVDKVYTGKAKEYTLQKRISNSIVLCQSFAELNEYKQQFEPYIGTLTNPAYKSAIYTSISDKEKELYNTQIGKRAPAFTLTDSLGKTYSLSDYTGKVVYLDLWASWCGPCRAETPAFKTLYNKYKSNPQIAFISIAVHDGVSQWKTALQEDKPLWTQLLDKDGSVWKAYVANTIPKFILIDKQGNIIDFNAPRPASGKEIERLLNQEIAK